MPKIHEPAKRWQKDMAARVGNAVRARRGELGITAAALARRTAELGYPVSAVAIGKLENNHRDGKFDLGELLALAMALDVPPVALIFGGGPDEPVEMLPGRQVPALSAVAWFTGDEQLADDAVKDPDSSAATLLRLARRRIALRRSIPEFQRLAATLGNSGPRGIKHDYHPLLLQIAQVVAEIDGINTAIDKLVATTPAEFAADRALQQRAEAALAAEEEAALAAEGG